MPFLWIDVLPMQAKDFTLAHASVDSKGEYWKQAMIGDGFKESVYLISQPGCEGLSFWSWFINEVCEVSGT